MEKVQFTVTFDNLTERDAKLLKQTISRAIHVLNYREKKQRGDKPFRKGRYGIIRG